jgi:hypothetical protein
MYLWTCLCQVSMIHCVARYSCSMIQSCSNKKVTMLNLSLSIDTIYWHIGWLYVLTYLSVVIFIVQLHIINIFYQFIHGVRWGTVASLGLLRSCLWWSICSAFCKVDYSIFCFFFMWFLCFMFIRVLAVSPLFFLMQRNATLVRLKRIGGLIIIIIKQEFWLYLSGTFIVIVSSFILQHRKTSNFHFGYSTTLQNKMNSVFEQSKRYVKLFALSLRI